VASQTLVATGEMNQKRKSLYNDHMKLLIILLLSFKTLTGLGQLTSTDNFSIDCTGFASFAKSYSVYYNKTKPENENIPLSTFLFNQLPDIIDSLEVKGYRLQYIHANNSIDDLCYKRIKNDTLLPTPLFDSLLLSMLTIIDRQCAYLTYSGGFVGNKYFIFHSTQPTGLIREVTYFLIKEE
jgi:hypothetical protein